MRIGHRGAAAYAPENTLASFRKALELGCEGIELDIHQSRDGELVVIHDPFVDRTTDRQGLVREMTLADIRTADAGGWFGSAFAGERVPTLAEVLDLTEAAGTHLFIEMKAGSVHYPGIEENLVKLIRSRGCAHRVSVSSLDHHGLKQLATLAPELSLGMLHWCRPLDPVGMARAIGAREVHPLWYFATPDLVRTVREAGLRVYSWVANDAQSVAMLQAAGVDGIMSDRPDLI